VPVTVEHNPPVPTFFFFPSPQTHPPKNLKIWRLIPSDTVKSPGFFKLRGTHKGSKQPLKKNKKKNLWWKFIEKSPMKTYMVKRALLLLFFYVFSIFILCLFSLLYFCLFKKRSKYVALDFSADFLIFNFYFVSSFFLI
jgi:hypothetical protein